MTGVNLLPRHRRGAIAARRRARRWGIAIGWYAAALVAAQAVASVMLRPEQTSITRSIANLERTIDHREQNIAARSGDAKRLVAELRIAEAVGRQPDWSVLIRIVGRAIGENAALSSWELEPIVREAGESGTPTIGVARIPGSRRRGTPGIDHEPTSYLLRLNGFAPSQSAITEAVLRLEETGLFTSVLLENARYESRASHEFASFVIAAELTPPAPGTEQPSTEEGAP